MVVRSVFLVSLPSFGAPLVLTYTMGCTAVVGHTHGNSNGSLPSIKGRRCLWRNGTVHNIKDIDPNLVNWKFAMNENDLPGQLLTSRTNTWRSLARERTGNARAQQVNTFGPRTHACLNMHRHEFTCEACIVWKRAFISIFSQLLDVLKGIYW